MNKTAILLVCALVMLSAGCRKQNLQENRTATQISADATDITQRAPLIAATFYPLYIILLNITDGADVQLSLLAPPDTGCLHDYQLTTADMKTIEKADIIVMNGAGMESFAEKPIAGKNRVIDASEGFNLVDGNPHIWVSSSGAMHQTQQITEALAAFDKKNAELYRFNAQEYLKELKELEQFMHEQLNDFAGNDIITFHEAFTYFASEFNLNVTAVIEREPGSEPTAKEINTLIDIIKQAQSQNKRIALFAEQQYSPSTAQIIARETGLPVYELDPAVTGELTADAYIQSMKKNTQVLRSALH